MPEKCRCWHCGKELIFEREQQERAYCPECYELAQKDHKELLERYSEIRKRIMFETAIRKMEKAGMYMNDYYGISKEVYSLFKVSGLQFLSSDEMIAAMVLMSNAIEFEVNKKMGPYVVDFFIPEMKVILEIDGDRHAMHYADDNRRDLNLRANLGPEWEVVRVGTTVFEKNPEKLPEAIEAIYNEKKRLRQRYGGILPESYSKRERSHYSKIAPKEKVQKQRWDNNY